MRSRRGLPFHRLHAGVTYAMAGLGLVALTRGDQVSSLGSGLLLVGYVASIWLGSSRPRAPVELARRVSFWNGLVIAAVLLQIARFFFFGASLLTLAFEVAGGLQIAKLFNRNAARDHQQIQALAFLHLIGATVLTTGLDYAAIFLGFVVLPPWMLALTHMRSEIERHYGGAPSADDPPAEQRRRAEVITRVLRSRRIAGPGFLLGTAALAIPLFGVTAAFFLLVPRVGMGFLSFGEGAGQTVAGFGSNVSLGDFGVIRNDPTVVLRVTPGAMGADPPESRSFRLRGTAFDQYDGRAWARTDLPHRRLRRDPDDVYTLTPGSSERDASEHYDIVLDPLDEKVVFTLPGTLGLTVPARVVGGIDEPRRLIRGLGDEVRYTDADGLPLRYRVLSDGTRRPASDSSMEEAERARFLQLPPHVERIAALAARIGGEGDDRDRARRLEAWLRDSDELEYTLSQPDTRGRDPLEVFLFEAKQGHCEYFSTALAVMLRTGGIPSRNVTGFVGGRLNPFGGYYSIRQGDAHSWVEAWLDGQWVTLDPTPPARGEMAAADGMLTELQAFLDAMRMRWARDVVGYDLRDQVVGLRRLFRFLRSLRSDESSSSMAPENGQSASARGSDSALWWLVPVGLFGLVLGWWTFRGRRGGAGRARRRIEPGVVALYRRLDRRLRELGHARPHSRTPAEHLAALRESGDLEGMDTIEEVTRAYLDVRFGGRDLPPEDVARLRKALSTSIRSRTQFEKRRDG